MSRQQMIFQLSYGSAKFQTSKCKSCQEGIQSDNLVVGVKSDAMYDPMWYHFQCFWTRCWYRKQMARHLDDYTELAGYSKLTTEDKQKFREALHELTGVSGDAHGLKRRSISEENLVDIESKRSKSDVVPVANLPKLSLSATGFLSRSKENLLDGGDQSQPSEKYFNRDEEEIVVSENLAVTVKKSPEGVAVVISAKDAVNNCSTLFKMNEQQWRKMVDVFDDVTNAITSMSSSQEEREIPLLGSQGIRLSADDKGDTIVRLTVAMETTPSSRGQAKDTTLTPDQWMTLTKRADNIEAALTRLAC
ncbi:uncharacterized protein [Littorina saxatilis]|uniref:PARP-type domain-containing protein n=1 Tax=Littorina saxatilis TaxID=31220 RepID=A0AAN9BF64_9CAEN